MPPILRSIVTGDNPVRGRLTRIQLFIQPAHTPLPYSILVSTTSFPMPDLDERIPMANDRNRFENMSGFIQWMERFRQGRGAIHSGRTSRHFMHPRSSTANGRPDSFCFYLKSFGSLVNQRLVFFRFFIPHEIPKY